MPVRQRFVALLVVWILGLLPLAVQALPRVEVQALELVNARATVRVQGTVIEQTVILPYHWDRLHKGFEGDAAFELPFNLSEVPTISYGLYIPRLGNAYEVWLNGVLLQRNGDLQNFNGADFAKVPRYIMISPGLLARNNLFQVKVRADVGRRGGLAPLVLGAESEIYPRYLSDYRWRYTGSLVVVIMSLLIGLLAFAFWVTQVDTSTPGVYRRDAIYLYAAAAELCWAFNIGNVALEGPPLDWVWWGTLTSLSSAVWVCSMTLFCVEVARWGAHPVAGWLRRWLGLVLLGHAIAAYLALGVGVPLALTIAYGISGLTSMVFAYFFIRHALGGASLSHKLVAVALLLNGLVGLRDIYAFRLSDAYGGNTLLRYSSMLFGLALVYIVVTRFRAASGQVRDLMVNMSQRIAQKESELSLSYLRMEQLAREQERTLERTRILRDMHDGVGSHISTAIRQLESGRATSGEVLRTLRESMDHLKLSIDTMSLPAGDLTAMLANLRYRLEPRFKASDIELQWEVDLLDPLDWLDDKAMRHLQFMVFEAVSNVLQHAHASLLRIELQATAQGGARVKVIDNGSGFDPVVQKRAGLGSLQERATAVSAQISINSAPGRTQVDILLPGRGAG